jgi:hypothetical protein
MATQTNVSSLSQVVQEHIARPRFKWPLVAIATLIVALIMGSFIATPPAVENEPSDQRAFEADAARYNGLAEFYLAKDEVSRQRAIKANAARYNGLAEFYLTENEPSNQPAFEANAARYNGLAEFYLAKNEAERQRAIEAEAARYNGLAEFFTVGS